MHTFLEQLKTAPAELESANARRAYALNPGFRRLVDGDRDDSNRLNATYLVWLAGRADRFVSKTDYPIVACGCSHAEILQEAAERGSPVAFCGGCRHQVRFSFSGTAIHCEVPERGR